jgi:DNA-binding transcriptional regulator YiaG
MKSSFAEQFEHRVRTRAVDLVSGGSSERISLRPQAGFTATVDVARALMRRGVRGRLAKFVTEQLAAGRPATVTIPHYDGTALKRELRQALVSASETRRVDGSHVAALRKRLHLTQEQFAGRFGLEVSTVRNWEQKRSALDGPAALLVKVMEYDPEVVERAAADDESAA